MCVGGTLQRRMDTGERSDYLFHKSVQTKQMLSVNGKLCQTGRQYPSENDLPLPGEDGSQLTVVSLPPIYSLLMAAALH